MYGSGGDDSARIFCEEARASKEKHQQKINEKPELLDAIQTLKDQEIRDDKQANTLLQRVLDGANMKTFLLLSVLTVVEYLCLILILQVNNNNITYHFIS